MITARDMIDFALCTSAIVAGLASSMTMIQMTNEVNRRLPEEDRLLEVFWYPGQPRKVGLAHRLFYPHSKLRNRRNLFAILMFAFLIAWVLVRQFYPVE